MDHYDELMTEAKRIVLLVEKYMGIESSGIKQEEVVERLSLFNNLSFTKKQWDTILRGCGCPKSSHFWTALRQNNLVKHNRTYTLVGMDIHSYAIILDQYLTINREYAKKSYNKAKARKKAQERKESFKDITFYMKVVMS